MPWGDRTGPMGLGPMSGRRAGYCGGYPMPGYANPTGPRLGRGRGFFGGGGRGGRHTFYATGQPGWVRFGYAPPTPEQEADALQDQADWLKDQLDAVNKRIEELKPKQG